MVDSIRWPRFTVETLVHLVLHDGRTGRAAITMPDRYVRGVRTGCGRKPGLSGPAPGPSLGAGTGWRKVYTPWRKAAGRRIRPLTQRC